MHVLELINARRAVSHGAALRFAAQRNALGIELDGFRAPEGRHSLSALYERRVALPGLANLWVVYPALRASNLLRRLSGLEAQTYRLRFAAPRLGREFQSIQTLSFTGDGSSSA